MKTRFCFLVPAMCSLAAFAHAAPMFQHPFLELPREERVPVHHGRYATIAPPNPEFKVGVLAIVPNNPKTSARGATALAEFASRRYVNGKWTRREIYVFADRQTAQVFAKYQKARRSKTLSVKDFRSLSAIWPNTLVFYSRDKKRTRILYPSRNPNSWWRNFR